MAETLTATQKAFEFADKLHFFYRQFPHQSSEESEGFYMINTTLLKYLGPEKYKKFCELIEQKNPTIGAVVKKAKFHVEFLKNPVRTEHILFDCQIRYYWGLSELLNTVKELV